MKKVKDTLLYLVPTMTGALLPLISLPLFTRVLTLEEYGALSLCQAYAIFVNGISNFGLNLGYERDFFENQGKKEGALLFTTLIFIVLTYISFGIITYLFWEQISLFLTKQIKYANLVLLAYLATGMTSLKSFYLIYFKNKENAKKFVWYTIDESLLSFVISIVLVVYLRIGVSGLMIAQLVASGIVFLFLTIYFLKNIPFSIDINLFKKSLSISLPLTPRIFFGIIGAQFDKYILGIVASVEFVGIYSLAQRVAGIIFTFMTAIQNVWSPVIFKMMFDKKNDSKKLIGSYLSPFFYISLSAGLFVSLFSEEIIFVLSPKEYHGASSVVLVLAILYCSYFFGKQNQLLFAGKTFLISILTLVGIILNVGINFVCVKFWGLMGIAWGNLLSGLITGTLSFFISQKYYRIYWEYKTIAINSFVYLLSTFILLIMIEYNISYYYRLFTKIFFIALFIYSGIKTKLITREKLNIVWNSIFSLFKLNSPSRF
jgi:O-antigen/teichoic acid export membrane protein